MNNFLVFLFQMHKKCSLDSKIGVHLYVQTLYKIKR